MAGAFVRVFVSKLFDLIKASLHLCELRVRQELKKVEIISQKCLHNMNTCVYGSRIWLFISFISIWECNAISSNSKCYHAIFNPAFEMQTKKKCLNLSIQYNWIGFIFFSRDVKRERLSLFCYVIPNDKRLCFLFEYLPNFFFGFPIPLFVIHDQDWKSRREEINFMHC